MTQSWVKRTAAQDLAIRNTVDENIHPVMLASFVFSDVKVFTLTTSKNPQNNWQYPSAATKKEIRRDKTPTHEINVNSLTSSVGEPQVVDIVRVWGLSLNQY